MNGPQPEFDHLIELLVEALVPRLVAGLAPEITRAIQRLASTLPREGTVPCRDREKEPESWAPTPTGDDGESLYVTEAQKLLASLQQKKKLTLSKEPLKKK